MHFPVQGLLSRGLWLLYEQGLGDPKGPGQQIVQQVLGGILLLRNSVAHLVAIDANVFVFCTLVALPGVEVIK